MSPASSLLRASTALAALLLAPLAARAQRPQPLVSPDAYLVPHPAGNSVVLLGRDGPVVVGPMHPAVVARTRALLDSLGAPPVRFVLAASGDSAVQHGDGGWTARGAVVVAHEGVRNRVRWAARTDSTVRGRVPLLGFSQVFQIVAAGDETHAVHHAAGYSDADFIAHFEDRKFLYMGSLFTNDGYPAIGRGGSIAGLIRTSKEFVDNYAAARDAIEPIIPGRGSVATFQDLKDYLEMLVAVRDRVDPMVRAGRTVEEVVATRPAAPFDARWGRGPVSADAFVGMVYQSLKADLARTAAAAAPARQHSHSHSHR
ncbi:MAG TPA: hypothetical protein VFS20_14470 [Longimicrobium sp.]|nr:hypothetical protein [Longimicrobium sp.]